MGVTTIHPSQRRVACESCRKQKARCQRLHQNDPSCARCTSYGVKCSNGRQKKIGRPRPATASTNSPSWVVRESNLTTYIPPTPPSTSLDNNPILDNDGILDMSTYQIDWTDVASSASTPLQVHGKVVGDALVGSAPTWYPMGIGSVNNDLPPWDIGFHLSESDFLFAYNSVFGTSPPNTNTPPLYLPQSPPSTVSSDQDVNNLEMPEQCNANTIDDQTALIELSKINIDLHARVSAAKSSKSHLTFNDLVYRQGPLYIDNYTLAEFILKISQSFLQVITKVLSTRKGPGSLPASPTVDIQISELLSLNHRPKSQQPNEINQPSRSPPSYYGDLSEPLSAPLALMITSIFIQLMSLYELMLEYTTARVDRFLTEPIAPVPILFHDGVVPENLCLQGALFSRAVVHVLERLQYVLGIDSGPGASQKGLLTAKQIKTLWNDLGSRRAIIPGQALMGPAILRRLFGKMTIVLERMAADACESSRP